MAVIHPPLAIIPLNGNGSNSPIKRDRVAEYLKKKKDPTVCCLQYSQQSIEYPDRKLIRKHWTWTTL